MIRTLLVVICIVFLALLLLLMRWGWGNRIKRQAIVLPALPAVPADLGPSLLKPLTGLYVGTTFATSWQDRVAHSGLGRRAASTLTLHDAGLLIDREGDDPIFIPSVDITEARLLPALAGKVVGAGGLLVISWQLGEHLLDTGLRADDKTAYPQWVRAIDTKARVQ